MRLFALPVVVLLLSCQDPGTNKTSRNPSIQKIPVNKSDVYDLEGYADEGGGDPYKLFDENAFTDPGNDNKSPGNFIPVTNPQPTQHPEIYCTPGRGNRIVANLRTSYQLKEVYLYDRSHTADSVWIYTGKMNQWKQKAAFITQTDPGLWGWRKFTIEDSTQLIMIRFSSFETAITEMVLYGNPGTQSVPVSHNEPIGPFAKVTMNDFLGANCYNETDAAWLKPFRWIRMYTFYSYFDENTVNDYPNQRFNMEHFGRKNSGNAQVRYFMEDIRDQVGTNCWYSIRGVPGWMDKKGFTDKDRPVTQIGMDPEQPASYVRHANLMWTLGAFFGKSMVPANELSLNPLIPVPNRRGIMDLFENGNEEDAWWVGNKYCNPVEYFAQSSADYDGHEGSLGPRTGLYKAGSENKLMTSGLIGLDTNRIRVYSFLCNQLRKDQSFIWKGGIQYHYYSTDGKKGLSPEEDSLRSKLSKVSAFTHRLQPGIDCILGENGYDKSQSGRQATPLIPGLSNADCQAIFILRAINAAAFSGFDRYILYWLKDTDPETDSRVYLTSGVIRQLSDGTIVPYPSWYYISTFVNRLANYRPDAIISENGKVWTYKYRNALHPDSVAYFVYCPSHTGTIVNDYTLKLSGAATVKQIRFSGRSASGTESEKKVENGILHVKVDESPTLIFAREPQ